MANLEHLNMTLRLMKKVEAEELPFTIHWWRHPLVLFDDRFGADWEQRPGSGDSQHLCGFAACVGGWMIQDDEHRKAGIGGELTPAFGGTDGISAMAEFWDVSYGEAAEIADSDSYSNEDGELENPSVSDAIARIEALIARHTPETAS